MNANTDKTGTDVSGADVIDSIRDEAIALIWDDDLTKKEAVAYALFMRGVSQYAIADLQDVSPQMVNKRLASARRKIGGVTVD